MADSADELDDRIDEVASGALETRANNLWRKQHSLKDLQAIRDRRAAEEAVSGTAAPLRFFQTKPPGAV